MKILLWSAAHVPGVFPPAPEPGPVLFPLAFAFDPAEALTERDGLVVLTPVADPATFNTSRLPVRLTASAYAEDVSAIDFTDDSIPKPAAAASAEAAVVRSGPIELALSGLSPGAEYRFVLLAEFED